MMFRASILCFLAFFAFLVLSAPAFSTYPEVIPGPGLPSLAELGVTSAQLYQEGKSLLATKASNVKSRNVQGNTNCYTDYLANIYDIAAIYSYVRRLGDGSCGSASDPIGGWSQLASAGTAQVVSVTWRHDGWGYTWCSRTAAGIWNIILGCGDMNDEFRQISGVASAYAYGDQYLVARNLSYPTRGTGMAWFPLD